MKFKFLSLFAAAFIFASCGGNSANDDHNHDGHDHEHSDTHNHEDGTVHEHGDHDADSTEADSHEGHNH